MTIPTALKWSGGLIVLDPSNEVAPMVVDHRRRAGRKVIVLDPSNPATGFNALDWIGRFGGTKEEDIVAVATWIMTDNARAASAARLGYLLILEAARDAGRKYGVSLTLVFQSIGQMREAYGGRDASSKWFESVSSISFAAINDPDTAEYISKRCGDTTVEVDQTNRSSGMKGLKGSSRSRSKQLTRRPRILPHGVMQMRADEQIVFTAGNPPLRCGRAIWGHLREGAETYANARANNTPREGMRCRHITFH